MAEILNTWRSKPERKEYFGVGSPVYENGDFKIYHQYSDCWLYTYKNIAITQLAGLNKDLLNRLANKERPEGQQGFLYDRALESLERGKKLINT